MDSHPDFITSVYAFDINDNWETTHPLFVRLSIAKSALTVYLTWEIKQEEKAVVNQVEWNYN